MPEGAAGINVAGKRLAGPIQGFGKMWQKTYQVASRGTRCTPTELIATWKQRFPDFWPEGNRFYAPLTGIEPGEVALIGMTLPGRMKLSTGVMVLYADDESFTLMTPQGHMFAGWITFSATERDDQTVAQAQVLMRASDPVFELGLTLGGHRQEDKFWNHTLSAWPPTSATRTRRSTPWWSASTSAGSGPGGRTCGTRRRSARPSG